MRWLYKKKEKKAIKCWPISQPTSLKTPRLSSDLSSHVYPHISSKPESKVWDSDQVRIIRPKHISAVRIWYSVVFEKELESRENNMWGTPGGKVRLQATKTKLLSFLFKNKIFIKIPLNQQLKRNQVPEYLPWGLQKKNTSFSFWHLITELAHFNRIIFLLIQNYS